MAKVGGKRPGAGRKRSPLSIEAKARVDKMLSEGGHVTPLEVMLDIMQRCMRPAEEGGTQPSNMSLALEAARSAAPYMHPKLISMQQTADVVLTGKDGGPIAIYLPTNDRD